MSYFANRIDAAHRLALELKQHTFHNPLMLALPRGGVPIAHEIFLQLGIPWDILVVRKIGAPMHREYGVGAIAEDGIPFIQDNSFDENEVHKVIQEEREELKRRIMRFRNGQPLPDIQQRDVILIDDGLATGVTAVAAARYIKKLRAKRVIMAVPVGPRANNPVLMSYIDEVICLERPTNFYAIGAYYLEFEQVTDEGVQELYCRRLGPGEIDREHLLTSRSNSKSFFPEI